LRLCNEENILQLNLVGVQNWTILRWPPTRDKQLDKARCMEPHEDMHSAVCSLTASRDQLIGNK